MNVLEMSGVSFSYGDRAVLSDITLRVNPGEAVALLGRNGAGKTTLTRLVVALAHPAAGEVRVGGASTRGNKPEDLARTVAYVFQHADQQLFARTVLDEVLFAPRQLGRDPESAQRAAQAALETVGLRHLARVHPYDLSAPVRKLVALAAALAQETPLLVMDEPTLGLDRAGRKRVVAAVRAVTARRGAVLAVTHDAWFLAEGFHRSLVLDGGRLVADATAAELLLDPERARGLGIRPAAGAEISYVLRLAGSAVTEDGVASALQGLRPTAYSPDRPTSA